jgi:hypothetical protein
MVPRVTCDEVDVLEDFGSTDPRLVRDMHYLSTLPRFAAIGVTSAEILYSFILVITGLLGVPIEESLSDLLCVGSYSGPVGRFSIRRGCFNIYILRC